MIKKYLKCYMYYMIQLIKKNCRKNVFSIHVKVYFKLMPFLVKALQRHEIRNSQKVEILSSQTHFKHCSVTIFLKKITTLKLIFFK